MGSNGQKGTTQRRPFVGLTYHYIEMVAQLGVWLNSLPFTYSRAMLQLHVNSTGPKFVFWIITMFSVIVLELGQIIWELIRRKLDLNMSRGEWCLIAFLFMSWLFMALIHLNILVHPHEVVNHLNQLLRLRKWFSEERLPHATEHKVVRIQMWFCCFQCFVQALMISVERENRQFLYSYLPEGYRSMGSTAIWITYAYYRVTTNFLGGLFQYFVSILTVQTCNQVLELR